MDLGSKIKALRENYGITQSELAKTLNVKNTVISNWEKNINKPNVDYIANLCAVFNVSADYFFDLPQQQKNSSDAEPPVSEEEKMEMAIDLYDWLIKTGFVAPGEDLTDQQLSALIGVLNIFDAIF